MKIEVNIINAFTKNGKGGNPAAIVLNADKLTSEQKQRIAVAAGLSETGFISDSREADFKLDFFTPTRQIAHCGHATIAAFWYLRQLGKITAGRSSKETIDDTREIIFSGDEVFMQQKKPVTGDLTGTDRQLVYSSLGLKQPQGKPEPVLINTGNSFLIWDVGEDASLKTIVPDWEMITTVSRKHNLIGYYLFANSNVAGLDATTRMFAPAYGIQEEAATGMAAGPLAAYLFNHGQRKQNYVIEQGHFMEKPSESLIKVNLEVHEDQITSLYAGGIAALTDKIWFDID